MNAVGTGVGRLSAEQERNERNNAIDNFAKRAEVLGRWPGTHTLGKEFETAKKK